MTSADVTTTTTGPYADLMSWKRRSERLVRASGAPDTMVRPGWLDGAQDLPTLPVEDEPPAVCHDLALATSDRAAP